MTTNLLDGLSPRTMKALGFGERECETPTDFFWHVRERQVQSMLAIGISARTICALRFDAMANLRTLCLWHDAGRKMFRNNLLRTNFIGPIRTREIMRALSRNRTRIIDDGTEAYLPEYK